MTSDAPKKVRYFHDLDTSTCICPCGSSITWSSFDQRFVDWKKQHEPHAPDGKTETVTEDGKRATG